MKYENREMKIDQLIGYVNSGKINLIASFQRNAVWTPKMRRKLLANIVKGRPIPAIFLYKSETGQMFTYNILDGKQRLESLILFIGNRHPKFKIQTLHNLFFEKKDRDMFNFNIELDGDSVGFADLVAPSLPKFLDYPVSTIEISIEDTSMSELVQLFVDINSFGVKVSRFDVVKAMATDPFLGTVLGLVAIKERRGKAIHYRPKSNAIARVMGKLSGVARLQRNNARVDRVWERLAEIAMFVRSKKHRRPVAVLNAFIQGGDSEFTRMKGSEAKAIREVFTFLDKAYKASKALVKSQLATNDPQFYTVVTSLLSSDLLKRFTSEQLTRKLARLAQILNNDIPVPGELEKAIAEFRELSVKATTDLGKREKRQAHFVAAISAL